MTRKELRAEIKSLKFKIYLLEQQVEAFGATNRYYFYEHHGRNPVNDNELMMDYCEFGGARDYASKHPQEINDGKATEEEREETETQTEKGFEAGAGI